MEYADMYQIAKDAGYHLDASSFFAKEPHFHQIKDCTLDVWTFMNPEEALSELPNVEILPSGVMVDRDRVAIHFSGNFKNNAESNLEVDALFESHPLFAGLVHYSDISEDMGAIQDWWIQLEGSFEFWSKRLGLV